MPARLHNLGMKTLTFIKKILCTQALYVISFHEYHIMVLMERNFIPEMPSNNSGVEKSSTRHMIREGEFIEWKHRLKTLIILLYSSYGTVQMLLHYCIMRQFRN